MSDNQPGRPERAGDRNRADRQKTRRLLGRIRLWEVPGEGGRAHRASRRQAQTRRSR